MYVVSLLDKAIQSSKLLLLLLTIPEDPFDLFI